LFTSRFVRTLFFPLTLFAMTNLSHSQEPPVINVWENEFPESKAFAGEEKYDNRATGETTDIWVGGVSKPTLTVIAPPEFERNGTAIMICPGGAYGGLSFEKEGTEMAKFLNQYGVTCFVLKYRHGGGIHQHPVPLTDVQRAMRVVRSQASEWKVMPERIGVLGFSAGGHLASSVGTHFDAGDKAASNIVDKQSCRPDFMVLIYPVISMDAKITHTGSLKNLLGEKPDPQLVQLMSNDQHVTADTPPTFIAHASDDQAVPVENALRFYRALVEHKVPAELHVFAEGGHGFGMRRKDKPVVEWPNLLVNWLRSRELAE
jgi:acetyl esterase/lipase